MIKKSITSKMKARRKNMVSEKPLGVRGSKNQQKSRAAKRQATKEIQKQFKSDHLGSKPTFKTSSVVAHRKKRQKKQQCKDDEEVKEKTQIDPAWEHVFSPKSHHKSKQSPSHQKSLEETKSAYIERDFSNVAEMASFYPTEEEFSNPIVYFEKLYSQGAWKHGCVKIIPPASFKPPFSFNYKSSQKLPFRSQTVQNLSRGKEFKYDSEGETFEQFKAKALKLEKAYLGKLLNAPEEERNKIIQQDYWNLVESHSSELFDKIDEFGESITHEEGEKVFRFNYAADLPVNKYGYGFPTKEQDFEHGSHPFNFNNINDQERSLLAFCKGKDISGINIPWFYMGMLYSSFCWHYEDLMMYSLNYMHEGAGKIWYSISPEHRTKFEKVAHKKFEQLRQQDPNYLLNINCMISPDYLTQNGVPVTSTHQKPGEFILTFPASYHAGFSLGFNAAEAVNFAAPTWLDWAEKALKIYLKTQEKVPVIPMQWLILETDYNLPKFVTKETTKEIRARSNVRKHFKKNMIDREDFEFKIQPTNEDDEVKYECSYCINLCYASFLKCDECKRHYCTNHGAICGCSLDSIKMLIRYTDKELREKAKKAVAITSKNR